LPPRLARRICIGAYESTDSIPLSPLQELSEQHFALGGIEWQRGCGIIRFWQLLRLRAHPRRGHALALCDITPPHRLLREAFRILCSGCLFRCRRIRSFAAADDCGEPRPQSQAGACARCAFLFRRCFVRRLRLGFLKIPAALKSRTVDAIAPMTAWLRLVT